MCGALKLALRFDSKNAAKSSACETMPSFRYTFLPVNLHRVDWCSGRGCTEIVLRLPIALFRASPPDLLPSAGITVPIPSDTDRQRSRRTGIAELECVAVARVFAAKQFLDYGWIAERIRRPRSTRSFQLGWASSRVSSHKMGGLAKILEISIDTT
jgi:hypothetical protein